MPSDIPRRRSPAAAVALALALFASLVLLAVSVAAQPLLSPVRLTLTPEGDALVSDHRGEAVLQLDAASGEVTGALAIRGKPLGVAWGGDRLFVGNDTTATVEIYRRHKNGRWQVRGRLGKKGAVPQPTDLAADETHELLFALSGGLRRVLVFNLGGELLGTLGGPEAGEHRLVAPTAVAVDPVALEVYVSDYGDPASGGLPAVRVFGYDGAPRGAISGESAQPGFSFSRPQGLAADGSGRLWMADALLGQVLVFDLATRDGVGTLGSYGSGPGQLLLPLDVALDPATGDVLVTDNRNARVTVFPAAALR